MSTHIYIIYIHRLNLIVYKKIVTNESVCYIYDINIPSKCTGQDRKEEKDTVTKVC